MLIDLATMKKIHDVQYEMMIELQAVMEELNVRYYFVHGSLLGAVTSGGFIPEDDDIDIAIFREDYNRLIEHGNKHLKKHYFIQSSVTDDFPLAFAKMRDSRTVFSQPVLDKYKCHNGIYIDIFPIDFMPESFSEKIQEKLLSLRLNSRLSSNNKKYLRKALSLIATLMYPSWQAAAIKREKLYSERKRTEFVNVTNGKPGEQSIPYSWFSDGMSFKFRDLDVTCPLMYSEYLSNIYCPDFESYNPAEKRISKDNLVKVSADRIEFGRS